MSLFTFVLDFQGGIFISQVRADDPFGAMEKWARDLDIGPIPGMGPKMKLDLINDVLNDHPVPLEGLVNAWAFFVRPLGRLGIIHFVRTENGPQ